MRDLTEIFRSAVTSNTDWSVSSFFLVLNRLRGNGVEISFWDGEENWASILENQSTTGYIWSKHPLVVIEEGNKLNIRDHLSDFKFINYLEVGSISQDLYKISDRELACYVDGFVSFDSFTIEDMWFETNSM